MTTGKKVEGSERRKNNHSDKSEKQPNKRKGKRGSKPQQPTLAKQQRLTKKNGSC